MKINFVSEYESDESDFLRRIKILQDECPSNPVEEWDMAFTFHLETRNLSLSSRNAECPVEWQDGKAIPHEGLFVLPVYGYCHSGIALSLTPFSCPWDSGLAGFMYVNKETFCEEFNLKEFSHDIARRVAESELSEVQQYLDGDVYGYVEEVRKSPEHRWKIEDSCWGFYGKDSLLETLQDKNVFDGKTVFVGDELAKIVF